MALRFRLFRNAGGLALSLLGLFLLLFVFALAFFELVVWFQHLGFPFKHWNTENASALAQLIKVWAHHSSIVASAW